jgi:hypothetical protein
MTSKGIKDELALDDHDGPGSTVSDPHGVKAVEKALKRLKKAAEPTWSEEWPEREGYFWIWFKRYHYSEPQLAHVQVFKSHSGFAYVAEGNFMYPRDLFKSFWIPSTPPKASERPKL